MDNAYNYSKLPERLRAGMKRYLELGIQPGHFLTAIIENDFKEAVLRADSDMIHRLAEIIIWFYEWVPMEAYGSKEKRLLWQKNFNR
jgi:hypothetical protein